MFKKIYLKLTLRLETFTHVVPLPFAIYFSVVTGSGSYLSKDEMMIVAVAGSINATALIILGCVWRWFYLKKIFKQIKTFYQDKTISNEEKINLKLKLLKYPFVEAKIIVLRWLTGIIGSHLLVFLVAGPRPGLHLTAPFLFFMITPISYTAYYFISENIISSIFKLRKVKQIEIGIEQIPQFNSFQRIILSMIGITLMPVIVLGYMLYGLKTGLVKLDDPGMHLTIMSLLFPVPVIIVGYVVAKTFRNGIMGINEHLNQLGKGNFSIVSMPTSSDDFGLQAYNLNQIIKQLNSLYREISDLNVNLEYKVHLRTEQLNSSLQKVEALKVQQDGDYYLTSLLLRPLGQNQAMSKNFDFNFLVKQKKTFEFRGRENEIGGDICVTHTIQLQGETFHVFLNGDAMGKSIQGAGGSLILGSVFQSIIERTLLSPSLSEQSPEIWLKNAFIEMHKIFESFSGSMLVSIVIGLLDDSNGFIYYLNAEHPPSILFRDGKAHYIEEESFFRKLGTLQINTGIFIQTFQMLPGDTLLIGSDGRDDIRIVDETQIANINSNPKRILSIVEEVNCELPQIYERLKTFGEIADDLSLLKIHYHKELKHTAIHSININEVIEQAEKYIKVKDYNLAIDLLLAKIKEAPEEYELLKYLSNLYARLNKFNQAIAVGIRYNTFVPSDSDFFYTLSTFYKFIAEYSKGIELSERLRLREPQNLKNILNLVDLYSLNQNPRRAEELLQFYLKLDPENQSALDMMQVIKRRKAN